MHVKKKQKNVFPDLQLVLGMAYCYSLCVSKTHLRVNCTQSEAQTITHPSKGGRVDGVAGRRARL